MNVNEYARLTNEHTHTQVTFKPFALVLTWTNDRHSKIGFVTRMILFSLLLLLGGPCSCSCSCSDSFLGDSRRGIRGCIYLSIEEPAYVCGLSLSACRARRNRSDVQRRSNAASSFTLHIHACIALHCIALHCIALLCIALMWRREE